MAYTQKQINDFFAEYKGKGYTDQQINEIANNAGVTEQNVLNARGAWLNTKAGKNYLSGIKDPIQRAWTQTFWTGDMPGAERLIQENQITLDALRDQYNIPDREIAAVARRYGITPYGVAKPTEAPTNPTQQQQQSYIQALRNNFENIESAPYEYQRSNVGAADGQMMGLGASPYASQLVQSLRQSSSQPFSTNEGIELTRITGGPSSAINLQALPSTSNLAFNPERLNIATAPANRGNTFPPRSNTGTSSGVAQRRLAPTPNVGAGAGEGGSDNIGYDFGTGGDSATGSVGQGINNNLADFGLALMAYGEAGKGIAPGSLAAGIAGNYIAGQQADAMGRAADTLGQMQSSNLPGMLSVSDQHGNVFSVSTPESIAAADAAMFGGMDMGGMIAGNSADIGPGYSF